MHLKEYLTSEEAANYLGCSKSTLVATYKIPCIKQGRKNLYPRTNLDMFLSNKSDKRRRHTVRLTLPQLKALQNLTREIPELYNIFTNSRINDTIDYYG